MHMHAMHYTTTEGRIAAFVGAGRKNLRVIQLDVPIRVRTLPGGEWERMEQIVNANVQEALRRWLAFGEKYGMTAGAERLLREQLELEAVQ